MTLAIISLIFGFALLIWSADAFTENGAKIANIFGISPLVIGLLIFGFGTSAPEMLVSALAAVDENPGLGIGNAIGSNIINISLVLGVSAMIMPIQVAENILKREWIFLLIVTLILGLLLQDKYLGRLDGILLLIFLTLFLIYAFRESTKQHEEFQTMGEKLPKSMLAKTAWMLIFSLIVLIASAKIVVFGGTTLARAFGVDDLIIGLSVVAFGTSLPELAVAIASALKKHHEMVVGNVIGSNLFNTACVLALPGVIHPSITPDELLSRDYVFTLALTVLLFLFSYKFKKSHTINRFEGFVLVAVFVFYLTRLL